MVQHCRPFSQQLVIRLVLDIKNSPNVTRLQEVQAAERSESGPQGGLLMLTDETLRPRTDKRHNLLRLCAFEKDLGMRRYDELAVPFLRNVPQQVKISRWSMK